MNLPATGSIDSSVKGFAGRLLAESILTPDQAREANQNAKNQRIKDDVTAGITLANAIRGTGIFPTMLLQMAAIGEESGSLDDMLGKVADHYETAVDNAVDSLSSLMEPMIMSVLGVLVGGLMIAMYLPIFMLGSVI